MSFLLLNVLGCGCNETHSKRIPPDVPLPFPEPDTRPFSPDDTSSLPFDTGINGTDTGLDCVDPTCDIPGIDPIKLDDQTGICPQFSENAKKFGLITSGQHFRATVVDYNQDGRLDIYLINKNRADQLFENTGSGFTDVTSNTGLSGVGGDHNDAVFADYDEDGDLDLFLVGDSWSSLYKNEHGIYTLLAIPEGIHHVEAAYSAVWLEGGFLIGTENGTHYYRYINNDIFSEVTTEVGLDDWGSANQMEVFDRNNDGHQDVYIANWIGQNRYFENQANGKFISRETELNISEIGNDASADVDVIKLPQDTIFSISVIDYGEDENDFDGDNHLYQPVGLSNYIDRAPKFGITDPAQSTAGTWGYCFGSESPVHAISRFAQENLFFQPVINPDDTIKHFTEIGHLLGINDNAQTYDIHLADFFNKPKFDSLLVVQEQAIKFYVNESYEVLLCPEEER